MMLGLDELATEIQSGIVISRVESKSNAGVAEMKVLSLRAINYGVIDLDELDKIKIGKLIDGAKITAYGDIIIKMNKPYDAVFVDEGGEGLLLPSFCCKVSGLNTDLIDPYYLTGYLNSQFAKDYMTASNGASAASLLKIRDIKKMPIALPSMQEQRMIGEIFKSFCMKRRLLQQMQLNELKLTEAIIKNAVAEVYRHEKK